jgi:CRP-like cAMP-binding protein
MVPLFVHKDLESQLLKGLSLSERELVLATAKASRIPANQIVIQQDYLANQLFLITSGQARYFFITEEGRKVLLFSLVPGDVFGGAAILSERSRYLLGTETVKETRVLVWPRSDMTKLTARYPRLMQNMLLIAYDYLGWYLAAHIGFTCHTAAQRFAAVLVTLAHTVGEKGPKGMEIDANNEDLANAAGITTFTASRLMSRWQRLGVILKKRGRVIILSPERLLSERPVKHEKTV